MRSSGVTSERLFCWFLPWLCCIGPTAVAAELQDPGRRLVRFPPTAMQNLEPGPEAAAQPSSEGEVVAEAAAGDRKGAARLPSPTTGARRFPLSPDTEGTRRFTSPFVGRSSVFAPPPSVRPSPLVIAPQPRFVAEPRVPPPDPRPPESPTNASNDSESANEREPIGPKPPENTNEWLARDNSLLLKPGEVQTEIGALYTRQEAATIVVLPSGAPVLERIRNRTFIAPFSIRYGWSENLEVFGVVPFGFSHFERDNVLAESTEEAGTLGDITAGFVYQITRGSLQAAGFHL